MKQRIGSIDDFINEKHSLSFMDNDAYHFTGDHDKFEELITLIKSSKYKNDLDDVSWTEKIFTLNNDVNISFIPKNFLDKIEKQNKNY
jgi:hypothetical protein